MLRKIVSGIVLALILTGVLMVKFDILLTSTSEEAQLLLETDKNRYELGENVTITLANNGDRPVRFRQDPPFAIYTCPDNELVYPESWDAGYWTLEPGANSSWLWRLDKSKPIEPGNYVIRGSVVVDTQLWDLSWYFTIVTYIVVPDDYETIQKAIDASSDGDTIIVEAGTYNEAIIMNKSINLIGVNGSDVTIIDAGKIDTDAVVTIESSNIRLENFTIQHTPARVDTGIRIRNDLKSVHGIVIHQNEIFNVDLGIENGYLSKYPANYLLSDVEITENTMSWNALGGIYLSNGTNLLVSKNIFPAGVEFGQIAIDLRAVNETEISGNNVSSYGVGLKLQKGYFNNFTGNTITDTKSWCISESGSSNSIAYNTITGANGIYVSGNFSSIHHNTIIDGKYNGISVRGVSNNIGSNTITDNWDQGITVWESSSIIINNTIQRVNTGVWGESYVSGNEIRNCTTGVHIPPGRENVNVIKNFFLNCEQGINIEGDFSNIASNTFLSCPQGVYILNTANGNVIYHNMFLSSDATDDSQELANSWDNRTMGGNYWFDYEYEDSDGDGFGDTPYIIYDVQGNENNRDNYPLVVPKCPIPVFYKETRYDCSIVGSITVSRFSMDENKMISFKVNGEGYVNLTIPSNLIDGSMKVFVDGTPKHSFTSWNETHNSIHFEHTTSVPLEVVIEAKFKTICPEDVNGDGVVNIIDIALVAKWIGKPPP